MKNSVEEQEERNAQNGRNARESTDRRGREGGHAAFIILRFRENIFLIFEVLEERPTEKER